MSNLPSDVRICRTPRCGRTGAIEMDGGEWLCQACIRAVALECAEQSAIVRRPPPSKDINTEPLLVRLRRFAVRGDYYSDLGAEAAAEIELQAAEIEALSDAMKAANDAGLKLRAALEIAQQAILESFAAQERGPQWYTHGADGMYRQVRTWLQKGMDACRDALAPENEPKICCTPGCGRCGAVEMAGGKWLCNACVREGALSKTAELKP